MISETISDEVSTAVTQVAARVGASVVEVGSPGASGAGVIWSADGTIITSAHVVPHDHAEVRLADGRAFPGSVTSRDQTNDLATLRVAAAGLPAATIGDARLLRAGELVLAVGHPWGMRRAATIGVISRAPSAEEPGARRELVVADILLGPGNSGGPLIDARGRVVGINAMVAGGRALAVPSHLAEQLLAGRSEPPLLGINALEIPLAPAMAAATGSSSGLLIAQVSPDSLAEEAGLLIGDLLVSVDGFPLDSGVTLSRVLAAKRDGSVSIKLVRAGLMMEVDVALAEPARRAA